MLENQAFSFVYLAPFVVPFSYSSALLPPRMRFRRIRKQIVRPLFLLHRPLRRTRLRGPSCHGIILCRRAPVFGSIGDAPNIAMVIECRSDQETIAAQRNTTGHTRG